MGDGQLGIAGQGRDISLAERSHGAVIICPTAPEHATNLVSDTV
jgi:hypothetical protein